MKNFYFSLFFLELAFSADAQIFNRVFAEADEQGPTFVTRLDTLTVAVHASRNRTGSAVMDIYTLDSQGHTVARRTISESEGAYLVLPRIKALSDGTLLMRAILQESCGSFPISSFILRQYDMDLNLVASYRTSDVSNIGRYGILEMDSNHIALIDDDGAKGFNANLDTTFSYERLAGSNLIFTGRGVYLGNDSLLLSSFGDAFALPSVVIYDIKNDTAYVSTQAAQSDYVRFYEYTDSTYFTTFPDTIHNRKFTISRRSDLQVLDSSKFNQVSSLIEPRLYFEQGEAWVALANDSFEVVSKSNFSSLGKGQLHKNILTDDRWYDQTWYNDSLLIVASEGAVESIVLGQPKAAAFDSLSYTIKNTQLYFSRIDTVPDPAGDDYLIDTHSDWEITFRNQSSKILDSLAFRYVENTPDPCVTDLVLVKLENLNIAAGDSFIYSVDSVFRGKFFVQHDSLQIDLKLDIASANGNIVKIGQTNVEVFDTNFIGIEELKPLNWVQIFPNPAQNFLVISNEKNESLDMELFDVSGKKWPFEKEATARGAKLDISALSTGMYFLKVRSKDSGKTFKFLKQ